MFSLKNFVKSGLIKAVGKMADYQITTEATEIGEMAEDEEV